PQTMETWYIPGKSPIRVSQLHQAVALDIETGRPTCAPYIPRSTRIEIFEFWPSDMLKLFRQAGIPRRVPPALPACSTQDPADARHLFHPSSLGRTTYAPPPTKCKFPVAPKVKTRTAPPRGDGCWGSRQGFLLRRLGPQRPVAGRSSALFGAPRRIRRAPHSG